MKGLDKIYKRIWKMKPGFVASPTGGFFPTPQLIRKMNNEKILLDYKRKTKGRKKR